MTKACAKVGACVCGRACGIGKSRLTDEVAAIATGRGAEEFSTYCQSHTRNIPFHADAGLLRAFFGVGDLDAGVHVSGSSPAARCRRR